MYRLYQLPISVEYSKYNMACTCIIMYNMTFYSINFQIIVPCNMEKRKHDIYNVTMCVPVPH